MSDPSNQPADLAAAQPAVQAPALTPAAVQQMIQDDLAAQLATLRTAGLIQTSNTSASS